MTYYAFSPSDRSRILARRPTDYLNVRSDELPNQFDRYNWIVSAAIISSNANDPAEPAAHAASTATSISEHAAETRERGKATFEMFRAPPTSSARGGGGGAAAAPVPQASPKSKLSSKSKFASSSSSSKPVTTRAASSINTNTGTLKAAPASQHAVLVLRKAHSSTNWTVPRITLDSYDVSTVRNTLDTLILSSAGLHIASVLGSIGSIVIEDPINGDDHGKIRLNYVVCVRETAGVGTRKAGLASVELDLGDAYTAAKWLSSDGDMAALDPCKDSMRELILGAYDFRPDPSAGKGPAEAANWTDGWQVAGLTLEEEKRGLSGLEEYLAGVSSSSGAGGDARQGKEEGKGKAVVDDWFAGKSVKRPADAPKKKNSAWKTPRKP